jgi:transcriptional regulator with XRE-family HTH domain
MSAGVRAAADTADTAGMLMKETFGQALRRLRGDHSLCDVAQLANCGKSTVGDLESGKRIPSPEIATALDQALEAGGELVALAAQRPGQSLMHRAATLQEGINEALAMGPMTDASVEEWEWRVSHRGRATRYRAESDLLPELLDDFGDLQRVLAHRHSPQVRRRLLRTTAHMSGLVALTLLRLGDPTSRSWWRTGRAAAAAAEDRAVLSWIYAQEAYQLYYSGDMVGAVELAARGQQLAGGLPCVGDALAASLEARAHAVL